MSHAYVQDADFTLYLGDVREVLQELPDESVNCVVTSPPYWGLRDYGSDGQLGLEPTPEAYVESMVAVFREVRRVLRRDGSLWLNIGDSYAAGGGFWPDAPSNQARLEGKATGKLHGAKADNYLARETGGKKAPPGLKPKDLVGIPWRLAFALQADGWYLRSEIIWSKPNPMPESVTDRPTKSHEQVFLLTRSPRYFFDQEAVREPHQSDALERTLNPRHGFGTGEGNGAARTFHAFGAHSAGRNVRSVWDIPTQPYAEAHFATYPEELVRRCVLAGCPEWVCGTCGKPRERIVERSGDIHPGDSGRNDLQGPVQRGPGQKGKAIGTIMRERHQAGVNRDTLGWSDCGHNDYRPGGVVLDPFLGSGTTALVARKHGRRCIGIELNPEYAALAARRLSQLSLLAVGGDPE